MARSIGERLAKDSIAAKIDDVLVDVTTPFVKDARVELVTLKSPEALEVYRHTAAHLMAHAVKELYGDQVQVTIGPAIENGFYYDFFCDTHTFSPEEFETIEKKMSELVSANLPLVREELSSSDAIKMFTALGENYKVELIEDLNVPMVTIYRQGDFADLCRGPHLPSTGYIKAFKLTSVAGAYWRGSEKNAMLQRIYATAFPDKKSSSSICSGWKRRASVIIVSGGNSISSLLVKRLALVW